MRCDLSPMRPPSFLQLEEEGRFKLFGRGELPQLLEQARFKDVQLYDSFGQPHQAHVAVCVRIGRGHTGPRSRSAGRTGRRGED